MEGSLSVSASVSPSAFDLAIFDCDGDTDFDTEHGGLTFYFSSRYRAAFSPAMRPEFRAKPTRWPVRR